MKTKVDQSRFEHKVSLNLKSFNTVNYFKVEDAENNNERNPEVGNFVNEIAKLAGSQDPHVFVKMEVDDVPVKTEPEEAENSNNGKLELKNSRKSNPKAKLKDVESSQLKIGVDSPRPGPSSGNLNATSKSQSEIKTLQLFDDNSAGFTWKVPIEKFQTLPKGKEAVKILEILSSLYADKIPLLKVDQDPPEKVNMKVDGILIQEEPKETKINKDGELQVDNSRNPKLKSSESQESTDVESSQLKIGVDSSRPGPSSENLTATSKSKSQAESETSQLPHDNSTGCSSLNSAASKTQEWISPAGKPHVLPLDKMTNDESLEFILKQLEIPESQIPEFREESKEFIELIGGLPLALQQAVAYIKQEKEERKLSGSPYKITDYVQEFKLSMEKFLSFSPVPAPDSSPTVFATWNVTLEKIQKLTNGKGAVQILEILPFLYADKIPLTFLRVLVPEMNNAGFSRALKLLEKYALIKVNVNVRDFCLSLHRQLQPVILHLLKESKDVSRVVMNLVEKYLVILENTKLSQSSDILLSMYQIFKNHFDLIPVDKKFFGFMVNFGALLYNTSQYSESLDVCKKLHSKEPELWGENHQVTFLTQRNIALLLEKLGRYDESLTVYKEILKKKENHPDFGVDHPETITTKYNMADVLRQQGKYQESLEISQQVLAQSKKVHGENHPETLKAQTMIALIHSELGDFSTALAKLKHVEKKQIEILGPHHKDVLSTKHNKAAVLYKMDKFEEASKMFNEVYEKRKEILGENHLDTINTLELIAKTLGKEGKFTEAHKLYEKVYKSRKVNLGEDHEETITTKLDMYRVLRQQGKYQEALEPFQQVLAQRNKVHGKNHPKTLSTQNEITFFHVDLGHLSQALDLALLQDLEKKQIESVGPHHPDLLKTKHDQAHVWFRMGQFEEVSKILHEVYEKRKEILGENHLDTISTLELMTVVLEREGKSEEALDSYEKVYQIRKMNLGEDHPDTINVKTNMVRLVSAIRERNATL